MTHVTSQTTADAPPAHRFPPALVLAIACVGQFMVVLDVSVINVALPAVRHALGFSPTGLQWVVNAYALTFGGFLLLGGRLADIFGRKRIFITGLGMFAAASLAGGLAGSAGVLTAARAVQGLGAAVLAPATLTLVTTVFPGGPARAKALGTWSAVGAGGGAAGGLIGGALTSYLSWRWTLLINVPIGVAAIVAAIVIIPESRRALTRRLDLLGAVLVTGGLAALIYAIVNTASHGWSSAWTLVPLGVAAVGLAAFVAVESRTAAPLMPLRLFTHRSVWAGTAVMLMVGLAFFSMWYFLSLYAQGIWHYSAIRTGFAFLPHTIAIIVFARLAPSLISRLGARTLILWGAALSVAGFAVQSRITPHSDYLTGMLVPGILMCAGAGLMMTALATTITTGVSHDEAGLVSGVINAARQIGGSIGLAVLATVAAARIPTPAALTAGYARAFEVAAAVLVAAIVVALALPRPEKAADKR
jgi:EmrB/QacA subfamily drug resistance transporter